MNWNDESKFFITVPRHLISMSYYFEGFLFQKNRMLIWPDF